MANYFKSRYERGLVYSPTWYGTLDYAPIVTNEAAESKK